MKEWIERLFNVRSGEWGDLLFFWVLNTLLCTGLALGEALAETLFLKRIGVDFLPFMFILCSLVAIPISLLLTHLQGSVRQTTLTMGIHGVALIMVAFSAYLVQSNTLFFGRAIGTPVFYLAEVLLTIVLSTHFS
ncbi:MAG TPA: hypothetical protein PKO06_07065, partial [Candidatus Ozemobacteraceae bacterium]|nr:hypothetical protein [Candidatus Ozemobacteraceae bacterium]